MTTFLSIFFFKGFIKYIDRKRRSKENIGPIFVEDSHLANMDEEEVEQFNAIFASVINNTCRPWTARFSELEDHKCGNSGFPFVDAEILKDQLHQLNVHKSVEPEGIHPRIQQELAVVMSCPLLIICQRFWESGKVPVDWKLANIISIYKKGISEDPGNYRKVMFH